jgi:hypothetical protein
LPLNAEQLPMSCRSPISSFFIQAVLSVETA